MHVPGGKPCAVPKLRRAAGPRHRTRSLGTCSLVLRPGRVRMASDQLVVAPMVAAGAAAGAAELAEQAASMGFVLWERAAQRIAAAASAARAGTGPPDPCRYPALIYVDRPTTADGRGS